MRSRPLGGCLLVAALIVAGGGSVKAAPITFTNAYEGDVLPTAATPAWTTGGTFRVAASSDGDVLSIDTGTDIFKTGFFATSTGWDGDSTTGSTVEVRLRQVSGSGRLQLAHKSGTTGWYYDLLIGTTRIAAASATNDLDPAGGTGLDIDMTQDRTLRFVLGPGDHGAKRTVDVYVDGDATAAFSLSGYANNSANRILIGDGASSGLGGVVAYDYVRWTNAEATPPAVPEPTAAAGTALGMVAMMVRRRWK